MRRDNRVMASALLVFLSAGCSGGPLSTGGEGNSPSARSRSGHPHARLLLENAYRYLLPEHGMIDAASGYPVEGWNHDPELGLFLRSFTQLTAIGEWVELLASIAAGQAAGAPFSEEEALARLKKAVESLRKDQKDPAVARKNLLGNFLGFSETGRTGPLARMAERRSFDDAFGRARADAIWAALVKAEWIRSVKQDTLGIVQRSATFGLEHFEGPMAPFADEETKTRIMDILDQRVVQVIFGDNANLSASLARAIGALLGSGWREDAEGRLLISEMERFLEEQEEGYRFLFNEENGKFRFGWNATQDWYFGWPGRDGWTIGHQGYLVNEFRGPTQFVVVRYDLPFDAVANLGFQMKAWRSQEGAARYTLAPHAGSSFQALGLVLFMGEMDHPSWRAILSNFVEGAIDYSSRHGLPGFLSESYSGNKTEYTGKVGYPDVAVAERGRITDAPSVYTLGPGYMVAPDAMERFLADHWEMISRILSDHGPWEGYKASRKEVIRFQTGAHVLSLLLGLLGTAQENMNRYLLWKECDDRLAALYRTGSGDDFLGKGVRLEGHAGKGRSLVLSREWGTCRIRGTGGEVVFGFPGEKGLLLSGTRLRIRYVSEKEVAGATLRFVSRDPAKRGVTRMVHLRFDATGEVVREIEVPLPATPGLDGVGEVVLRLEGTREPLDLRLLEFGCSPWDAATDP